MDSTIARSMFLGVLSAEFSRRRVPLVALCSSSGFVRRCAASSSSCRNVCWNGSIRQRLSTQESHPMKSNGFFTALIAIIGLVAPFVSFAVDAERRAEVAQRGAEVMPFSLKATTHIFIKSDDGGNQQVIAKNPADSGQIRLIRKHLREIEMQFQRGDFSGPARAHGTDMPGLAQLRAAKPGQVSIKYKYIKGGGELSYRSDDPKLVSSLHAWFDAQISDHGADAMDWHMHHDAGTPPP